MVQLSHVTIVLHINNHTTSFTLIVCLFDFLDTVHGMSSEPNECPKKNQQQQEQSLAYRQRQSKNIIRTFQILRCVRWQTACTAASLRIV